nr:amidohydrolase [Nakamurella antarctica]
MEALRCDLTKCASAEQVYAEIARYAASEPDLPWILGGGWRMPFFPGGSPRREDLDKIVPDRPVFLINTDHHGAWVNSTALELAGIDATTPDPEDGRIDRDSDGVPSGMLHEGAADIVGAVLPTTTSEEVRAGVLTGERVLFGFGITGWEEAILGSYAGYEDFTPYYRELLDEGLLRGRVSGALWVSRDFDGMTIPEFVADLERRRDQYARAGLRLDTAKIMVDGVPENETAAMEEPYQAECSCTGGRGLSYFNAEQLCELVPLLNARGISAHFHAIGDRAVRYCLDAVEGVPATDRASVRNHIAHLQVINPDDLARFGALGVTANIQPLWACLDAQMATMTLPLMGELRSQWQYQFASLERAGANIVCGSDWPVSTSDPWQGMHVAVNRRAPGETEAEPLLPHEALSLASILTAYTRGSHDLLGMPGGVIEVGGVCDLAIADRDPFAGPASDIYLTRNVLTTLDGEIVFEAEPRA